MGLNYKEAIYKEVSYHELDKFINDALPILNGRYEAVAYEEWNNDSCYVINVDGEIGKWDEKDLNEMLATGKIKSYRTRLILNHLCQRGDVEKGAYLIRVSW